MFHLRLGSEHRTEGILDSEVRVRQEIKSLLEDSQAKVTDLNKISTGLDNSLEELAHQKSTARDLINESYQSYKAVLEKCRDTALSKLNDLYRERELIIMKENDAVGKTIGNLEDARSYTGRLLDISTIPEIMYLKKIVSERLQELNNNTQKFDETFNIEFCTDFTTFEAAVKENFGDFRTEKTEKSLAPLIVNHSLINGCHNAAGSSMSNSSPVSLPTSMQSSFDGDLSGGNLQSFSLAQSPPLSSVNTTAVATMPGFSSIAEYNLAQLATLAENTNSPAASPTSPFNLADLLTTDTAYKNLASLAKLGLNAGK